MRTSLSIVALILLFAASAAHAEIVFSANPTKRANVSVKGAELQELTSEERGKYVVVIERDGDRFYWTSRERTELAYMLSGAFHIFIAINGAGYIKIFDTSLLGDLAEPGQARFQYIEHMHLWLDTITYFGESDTLSLP